MPLSLLTKRAGCRRSGKVRASRTGFSLAELLMALLILGQIATFTIPKVLVAQENGRNRAIAKEAVAIVAAAYAAYQLENIPGAATQAREITPYLNYVRLDSSGAQINNEGGNQITCNGSAYAVCLRLHNGGVLGYKYNLTFNNTASTNAVYYWFDPDGKYTLSGETKSLQIYLYYNGRVTTRQNVTPNTCTSEGTCVSSYADPS